MRFRWLFGYLLLLSLVEPTQLLAFAFTCYVCFILVYVGQLIYLVGTHIE